MRTARTVSDVVAVSGPLSSRHQSPTAANSSTASVRARKARASRAPVTRRWPREEVLTKRPRQLTARTQQQGQHRHLDARLEAVHHHLEQERVDEQQHRHHHEREVGGTAARGRGVAQRRPPGHRVAHATQHQPQRGRPQRQLEEQERPHRGEVVEPEPERDHADALPERVVAVGEVDAVERRAVAVRQVPPDGEVVVRVVEGDRERRRPPEEQRQGPTGAHDERRRSQLPGERHRTIIAVRGPTLESFGASGQVRASRRARRRPCPAAGS